MTTLLSSLQRFDLIYVATPFTRYPGGIEEAFREACRLTAGLLRAGLSVYSPIAHTYPIAVYGRLNPLDHDIWLPFDAAMMAKADAMIVAMMDGWETSQGIAHEIKVFENAGKPIFYIETADLRISVTQQLEENIR